MELEAGAMRLFDSFPNACQIGCITPRETAHCFLQPSERFVQSSVASRRDTGCANLCVRIAHALVIGALPEIFHSPSRRRYSMLNLRPRMVETGNSRTLHLEREPSLAITLKPLQLPRHEIRVETSKINECF